MGTESPVVPTVTVTHKDLLQRAVDLLYAGNDPKTGLVPLESTRAAAALTSIAHELRVASTGGRYRSATPISLSRPADFSEDIIAVQWRAVEGAKGYEVHVHDGRTTVEPVFSDSSREELTSP